MTTPYEKEKERVLAEFKATRIYKFFPENEPIYAEENKRIRSEAIDFLSHALDTIARSVADAGRVEKQKHFVFECNGSYGGRGCYETWCEDTKGDCKSKEAAEVRAHNAAIEAHDKQLADYGVPKE